MPCSLCLARLRFGQPGSGGSRGVDKVEGGGAVSPPAVILTLRERVTVSGDGLGHHSQEVVLTVASNG